MIRYSNEELSEFRQLVETKLDDAVCAYNTAFWKLQSLGNDLVEREETYVKASRLKRNIDNLRSALLRIENQTYGVCIVTGTLIPKPRLLAVPHTTINTEARVQHMRMGA